MAEITQSGGRTQLPKAWGDLHSAGKSDAHAIQAMLDEWKYAGRNKDGRSLIPSLLVLFPKRLSVLHRLQDYKLGHDDEIHFMSRVYEEV